MNEFEKAKAEFFKEWKINTHYHDAQIVPRIVNAAFDCCEKIYNEQEGLIENMGHELSASWETHND